MSPLQEFLSSQHPLILDGAMGTELQRRGVDTGLPLWSANALIVHPETVLQIHKEYIDAGASIITTATFRTTRRTFRRAGLPDRSKQLTALAVELARSACASFPDRTTLIAGSVSPLEDCYRPDLVPTSRELEEEHSELIGRLVENGVDFILLETMNTVREAFVACKAAKATGKDVVVSFVCDEEGLLLSGETLTEAVSAIHPLQPTGFSINCVSPRHLATALHVLQSITSLPLAVYGNVGLPESDKHGWEFTHDVSEEEYAIFARDWRMRGASIIGGCCGTTPGYIQVLRNRIGG